MVDLPRCKWYPLLKAIILPLRSKRIAKNYQAIWTEQGSPLLAISRQQKDALQAYLDTQNINAQVEIAMTYGNPSIQSTVICLKIKLNELLFCHFIRNTLAQPRAQYLMLSLMPLKKNED